MNFDEFGLGRRLGKFGFFSKNFGCFRCFRKIWQIRGFFAFSFFSQNPVTPKVGLPAVALAKVGHT